MVRIMIVFLYVPVVIAAFLGALVVSVWLSVFLASAAASREHRDMARSWRTKSLTGVQKR